MKPEAAEALLRALERMVKFAEKGSFGMDGYPAVTLGDLERSGDVTRCDYCDETGTVKRANYHYNDDRILTKVVILQPEILVQHKPDCAYAEAVAALKVAKESKP